MVICVVFFFLSISTICRIHGVHAPSLCDSEVCEKMEMIWEGYKSIGVKVMKLHLVFGCSVSKFTFTYALFDIRFSLYKDRIVNDVSVKRAV